MRRPLSEIQCFLLDMDGTFYLDNQLLQGALHFVDVITLLGRKYIFLTNNSSRHRSYYAEKISGLGLAVPESRIFTSGEATALYLKSESPGARLYVVGTE